MLLCIVVNTVMWRYMQPVKDVSFMLEARVEGTDCSEVQIFWAGDTEFAEERSATFQWAEGSDHIEICLEIPSIVKYLRIDFGALQSNVNICDIKLYMGKKEIPIGVSEQQFVVQNQLSNVEIARGMIQVATEAGDPFLVLDVEQWALEQHAQQRLEEVNQGYIFVACVYFDLFVIMVWIFRKKIYSIVAIFVHNGALIWDLAVNDFKTKFAGAAFGTIWAFVQPVVTILVYWFVFQVGFRSGNSGSTEVPYALWLSTGLIPWFFFSEAWNSATNSLIEYSYLVKKVVFNVTIIPCVKIFSALFVHIFFLILLLFMYIINGVAPTIYWIQVLYYSFAMFVLVLALTYVTAALVLFFRDMSQIITVFLQVGVWLTPIMWEISVIPSKLQWIFKLNPMYYIVSGYRQALIYHEWAWNNVNMNIYFCSVTIVLLVLGQHIFEKMKPHFADVL